MRIILASLLLAVVAHEASSFSLSVVPRGRRTISRLFSTVVEVLERPPAETEERYGTIVGDTKGAALLLDDVAISRGAEPLLKNIEWSVQPNERWGIVGINGAGKICNVISWMVVICDLFLIFFRSVFNHDF
jgi:ABC-type multidrug transport system fused ATPase/permease subunit